MGRFDFPSIQTLSIFLIILITIPNPMKTISEAAKTTRSTSKSPRIPNQIQISTQYLKTSCNSTSYPRLCFNSLSIYAIKIKTNPKTLALAALHVNLAAARSTSAAMIKLSKTHGLRRREASAIGDCVEQISDSVFELQRSINELCRPKYYNFGALISDIQTWVSSALTDEDTCMDGFGLGFGGGRRINRNSVKAKVRRHIVKVAHLTSNSLALISKYASASAAEDLLP